MVATPTLMEQGYLIGVQIGHILREQTWSYETIGALAEWHYRQLVRLQGVVLVPLERYRRSDAPFEAFCDGFVEGFRSGEELPG